MRRGAEYQAVDYEQCAQNTDAGTEYDSKAAQCYEDLRVNETKHLKGADHQHIEGKRAITRNADRPHAPW